MWEPNAAQTAVTVEQMTSCMTDQVYLSQHPDGQAKISPCGFSAEPNHNWITHRQSFYSACVIPHELEWNPVSVKHQRVQDCKSKAIPLWITHPEGIPVRGVLANHAELNLKRERGLTFASRATGFSFSQIIESIMCTRSNGKQLTVGIQPLRKLLDRHSSLNTVSCNIWQLLVEEPHKN